MNIISFNIESSNFDFIDKDWHYNIFKNIHTFKNKLYEDIGFNIDYINIDYLYYNGSGIYSLLHDGNRFIPITNINDNCRLIKLPEYITNLHNHPYIIKKLKYIEEYVNKNNIDIICLNEFSNVHYTIVKNNNLFENYYNTYDIEDKFIGCNNNVIFFTKKLVVSKLFQNLICLNDNLYIMAYRGKPGHHNKNERVNDILTLLDYINSNNFIIIGDTNARNNDYDETNINKYLNDAWIIKGNNFNKFTIDGYNNNYFKNSFQFKSRYDRCYCTKNIKILNFDIIFQEKYEDLKIYNGSGCISDHYGIFVNVYY